MLKAYRTQASPRIAGASRWTVRTCRFVILQARPWSGPLGSLLDRVEAGLYQREKTASTSTTPAPSGMYDLSKPFELTPARRAAIERAAARAKANTGS